MTDNLKQKKSHKRLAVEPTAEQRRRRGGRPRIGEPRDHSITGSFSLLEKNRIVGQLEHAKISCSEFVRLVVLEAIDQQKIPQKIFMGLAPEASKMYAHLAPLAGNFNQIAKHLNQRPATDPFTQVDVKALRTQVEKISTWLAQLRAALIRSRQQGA